MSRGHLVAGRDSGGDRHFLDGKAVHAGQMLEILMPSGKWLPVRYESSWDDGFHPRFLIGVGHVVEGSDGELYDGDAEIILRSNTWDHADRSDPDALARANFRWPEKDALGHAKPGDDTLDVRARRSVSA